MESPHSDDIAIRYNRAEGLLSPSNSTVTLMGGVTPLEAPGGQAECLPLADFAAWAASFSLALDALADDVRRVKRANLHALMCEQLLPVAAPASALLPGANVSTAVHGAPAGRGILRAIDVLRSSRFVDSDALETKFEDPTASRAALWAAAPLGSSMSVSDGDPALLRQQHHSAASATRAEKTLSWWGVDTSQPQADATYAVASPVVVASAPSRYTPAPLSARFRAEAAVLGESKVIVGDSASSDTSARMPASQGGGVEVEQSVYALDTSVGGWDSGQPDAMQQQQQQQEQHYYSADGARYGGYGYLNPEQGGGVESYPPDAAPPSSYFESESAPSSWQQMGGTLNNSSNSGVLPPVALDGGVPDPGLDQRHSLLDPRAYGSDHDRRAQLQHHFEQEQQQQQQQEDVHGGGIDGGYGADGAAYYCGGGVDTHGSERIGYNLQPGERIDYGLQQGEGVGYNLQQGEDVGYSLQQGDGANYNLQQGDGAHDFALQGVQLRRSDDAAVYMRSGAHGGEFDVTVEPVSPTAEWLGGESTGIIGMGGEQSDAQQWQYQQGDGAPALMDYATVRPATTAFDHNSAFDHSSSDVGDRRLLLSQQQRQHSQQQLLQQYDHGNMMQGDVDGRLPQSQRSLDQQSQQQQRNGGDWESEQRQLLLPRTTVEPTAWGQHPRGDRFNSPDPQQQQQRPHGPREPQQQQQLQPRPSQPYNRSGGDKEPQLQQFDRAGQRVQQQQRSPLLQGSTPLPRQQQQQRGPARRPQGGPSPAVRTYQIDRGDSRGGGISHITKNNTSAVGDIRGERVRQPLPPQDYAARTRASNDAGIRASIAVCTRMSIDAVRSTSFDYEDRGNVASNSNASTATVDIAATAAASSRAATTGSIAAAAAIDYAAASSSSADNTATAVPAAAASLGNAASYYPSPIAVERADAAAVVDSDNITAGAVHDASASSAEEGEEGEFVADPSRKVGQKRPLISISGSNNISSSSSSSSVLSGGTAPLPTARRRWEPSHSQTRPSTNGAREMAETRPSFNGSSRASSARGPILPLNTGTTAHGDGRGPLLPPPVAHRRPVVDAHGNRAVSPSRALHRNAAAAAAAAAVEVADRVVQDRSQPLLGMRPLGQAQDRPKSLQQHQQGQQRPLHDGRPMPTLQPPPSQQQQQQQADGTYRRAPPHAPLLSRGNHGQRFPGTRGPGGGDGGFLGGGGSGRGGVMAGRGDQRGGRFPVAPAAGGGAGAGAAQGGMLPRPRGFDAAARPYRGR